MKGSRRRKRATRIAGRIGGPKVLGPNFKFRSMIGAGMRKGPPWCGEPFKKSLCICKPGPVSTLRRISIIYLAVPSPARSSDLPSGIERVVLIHLAVKPRYTWSFSPWGLPSHAARTACWWALTPPFHPYPVCTWRVKFLQHYLSLCGFSHKAPAFHRVRCPLQPGLSSPHKAERWNGVVCGKYRVGWRLKVVG